MEKTMRAVSVILSLFSILITLSYQTSGADLPEGRDRAVAAGHALGRFALANFSLRESEKSNWTAMEENPAPDEGEKNEVVKHLGNLPAFFIENQGQVAEEARYYFKGSDTVYFTGEAVVFQKTGARGQGLGDRETEPASLSPAGLDEPADHQSPPSLEGRGKGEGEHHPIHPEGQHVQSLSYKLEFVGANPTAPVAKSELEGRVNYLIGNDPSGWHTDIPTYQEIVYPGLYGGQPTLSRDRALALSAPTADHAYPEADRPKGLSLRSLGDNGEGSIDLVYKGVPGGMKYEFIVHPGANPDDIRLAYTGIEGLSIDDSGNLIIHTALGDVKDEKPYTYQEINGKQVEVECRFIMESSDRVAGKSIDTVNVENPPSFGRGLQKTVYGFAVGDYDPHYPLVIDPGLQYSTFLGGSDNDWGSDIAVDASGNAYVTGYTSSSNFPTTPGAYDTSYNGSDAFVTKLNPAGSGLVYSTFLGGGSMGNGIAVDTSGNAYVTGWTESRNFPTTTGAFDTSYNDGEDAFVTKLNPTGSGLVYSTFLGGEW